VISLGTGAAVAFVVALVVTTALIRFLGRRGLGQPIRPEGPVTHLGKAGTPTLGGIAIACAALAGYLLAHAVHRGVFTRAAPLSLLAVAGFGAVGLLDDVLKLRRAQNKGLSITAKAGLELLVAVAFAILALYWAREPAEVGFVRLGVPHVRIPSALWLAFVVLVLLASSNAVNLTDGLDGLAAGCSSFIFGGMAIVGYFQFRHEGFYHLVPAFDLSLVAAALTGACLGFLWFNAPPARIIMGDTGALALGAGLGALAIEMNIVLLLPILAFLFVATTLSVIIQVVSFRLFGRRVFRMAPIHHHFELSGWPETTVIVRFWIASAIFTSIGLAIFFGYFISQNGAR
jgi:phospho-N-acetylmuramoyl-pentapeptide-transferase